RAPARTASAASSPACFKAALGPFRLSSARRSRSSARPLVSRSSVCCCNRALGAILVILSIWRSSPLGGFLLPTVGGYATSLLQRAGDAINPPDPKPSNSPCGAPSQLPGAFECRERDPLAFPCPSRGPAVDAVNGTMRADRPCTSDRIAHYAPGR